MKNFPKNILIVSILAYGLVAPGGFLLARESEVVNSVSVSADSDGNSGGNVSEGSARVDVRVEQEVNGVKQDPIVVIEESSDGSVVRELDIVSPDGTSETRIRASVESGSETSVEDPAQTTREDISRSLATENSGSIESSSANSGFFSSAVRVAAFLFSLFADNFVKFFI